MKRNVLILCIFFPLNYLYAQSHATFNVDSAKLAWQKIPINEKTRVKFVGFQQGPGATIYNNVDSKLTQMLSNEMQQLNCFRLLENVENLTRIHSEVDQNKANRGALKDDDLDPQITIKGEIEEFTFIRGKIILQLTLEVIHSETGELLFSKQINSEKSEKITPNTKNIAYNISQNPEVCDMLEKNAVSEFTYFLAYNRDRIHLYDSNQTSPMGSNETIITLKNANYDSFTNFIFILKSSYLIKSLDKEFDNNVGTFTIKHSGSTEDLLDQITKKLNKNYEVTGFDRGKISINVK